MPASRLRLGIDLGGTKIASVVLDDHGQALHEQRLPTPRHDYDGVIAAIVRLRDEAIRALGAQEEQMTIGIGMPGSVSPQSKVVQNANSTWLNGRDLGADLEHALGQPLRLANDANCMALSEATDGAARGARTVFGVILGTGCGGGLIVDGRILGGRNRIGGEWGHNPLPWARDDEHPGPHCWCGRQGCLETWVSGTGMARDHAESTQERISAEQIARRAARGDAAARATLERHAHRLARGLAHVVNIFDPQVIVLGGGLSKLEHLYDALPGLMAEWIFADDPRVDIRAPMHGDASGVRGAARLWDHDGDEWIF